MATLNIKDPEVHRMAMELAHLRHTSATGAVREALTEALAREPRDRGGMAERMLAISRRSAARPEPFLTDDDLFDELGLPR